ncbi:hypothetical protein HKX48_000966 [Thoreauomyces humboldtii]|nr:hypothetical protein HKX48_000966 [Thoreauomyces humboldtii]
MPVERQLWDVEPIKVPKDLQRYPKDSLKNSGLPEIKCIVFSPNAKTDEKWLTLERKYSDKMLFKTTLSNEALETVVNLQRSLFEKDVNDTMLLCLDDFGSGAKYQNAYGAALDSLATKYRWAGISIIGAYHGFKQLSPVQRCQMSHWFLFRMSDTEAKKITPELRCHLDDKTFQEMMHEATAEPFSFLYINTRSPSNDGVFHVNQIG